MPGRDRTGLRLQNVCDDVTEDKGMLMTLCARTGTSAPTCMRAPSPQNSAQTQTHTYACESTVTHVCASIHPHASRHSPKRRDGHTCAHTKAHRDEKTCSPGHDTGDEADGDSAHTDDDGHKPFIAVQA